MYILMEGDRVDRQSVELVVSILNSWLMKSNIVRQWLRHRTNRSE